MPSPERIICGDCQQFEPCRCPRQQTGQQPEPQNPLTDPKYLKLFSTPAGALGAVIGLAIFGIKEYVNAKANQLPALEEQKVCRYCGRESVAFRTTPGGSKIELCGIHARAAQRGRRR